MKQKKFVIICHARTGSNYLCGLLGSLPSCSVRGELLGINCDYDKQYKPNSVEEYLNRNVFKRYNKEWKYAGFKIFYSHITNSCVTGISKEDIINFLRKNEDIKLIHLKRENQLETAISWRLAEINNNWVHKPYIINKTELDPGFCRNLFKNFDEMYRYIPGLFEEGRLLEVTYEDLISKKEIINKKILDFLEAEEDKLESTWARIKQNKLPLNECIINYKDLKKEFKSTPWYQYFTV